MSDSNEIHPCQTCGACCASFRVSFNTREIEKGGLWQVPSAMAEEGGNSWLTMKGTGKKHRPSCEALKGTIGSFVSCSIYQNRPSPCRNFLASYEDGIYRPRCDEARKKHGLRPLGREAFNRKNQSGEIPA